MDRTYIVECYWPGVTQRAYAETVTRARAAADGFRTGGLRVRFLDSLLVPSDEAAYYRFAGGSVADVEKVCRQAQVPFDRILEYIDPPDCAPFDPVG